MNEIFEPHEVLKWEHRNVSVCLSALDGTTIDCGPCQLLLTNRNIRVKTDPVTYNVAAKGDRRFDGVVIPLHFAKPHRFIQPWFGPYKWETLISHALHTSQLEPRDARWKLALTFNDGGALEYRTEFLRQYSALAQAKQNGMEEALPVYSES